MRIVNLVEDTPGTSGCAAEHGLCIYAETARHRVLVDTGASELTWKNAERLGIDVPSVEAVILSHGHNDHGGGIPTFLERNSDAKIYMHKGADARNVSLRGGEHYIGLAPEAINSERVHIIGEEGIFRINEEVSVFAGVHGRRLWPEGNLLLKRETEVTEKSVARGTERVPYTALVQDDFAHEQNTVIEAEGKRILIAGCAHNGILNILDRFRELYGGEPDKVISGFHMIKGEPFNDADYDIMRQTAEELSRTNTCFVSGHCTGEEAFSVMKEILKEKLIYMHSGDEII